LLKLWANNTDTSQLQFTHNSSFPGTVGAEATIQGKNIHFAPGKDTEANIKHEVAHDIINTQRGTPPAADTMVNGQAINTSDEMKADAMMSAPLQMKTEGASTQQLDSGQQVSSSNAPIQRVVDGHLMDQHKQTLHITTDPPLIELSDPSWTLDMYIGSLPREYTNNIASIAHLQLGNLFFSNTKWSHAVQTNDTSLLGMTGIKAIATYGGGGYNPNHDVIVVPNMDSRTLLHELGHYKQHHDFNASSLNVNVTILEYHNVILHENLFAGEPPRVAYTVEPQDVPTPRFNIDKVINEETPKGQELIREMLDYMDNHPAEYTADIKQRVISSFITEYYQKKLLNKTPSKHDLRSRFKEIRKESRRRLRLNQSATSIAIPASGAPAPVPPLPGAAPIPGAPAPAPIPGAPMPAPMPSQRKKHS